MMPKKSAPSIRFAILPCSLGRLLVAATDRGVCAVSLGDSDKELRQFLAAEYPDARITRDEAGLRIWSRALVEHLAGRQPMLDLPTDVTATPFQRRVWQELCKIPQGRTRSYREIAAALGQPEAARAVARACATNPIALIVPCHRVIRADGGISGYRWGVQRKQALLARESSTARR